MRIQTRVFRGIGARPRSAQVRRRAGCAWPRGEGGAGGTSWFLQRSCAQSHEAQRPSSAIAVSNQRLSARVAPGRRAVERDGVGLEGRPARMPCAADRRSAAPPRTWRRGRRAARSTSTPGRGGASAPPGCPRSGRRGRRRSRLPRRIPSAWANPSRRERSRMPCRSRVRFTKASAAGLSSGRKMIPNSGSGTGLEELEPGLALPEGEVERGEDDRAWGFAARSRARASAEGAEARRSSGCARRSRGRARRSRASPSRPAAGSSRGRSPGARRGACRGRHGGGWSAGPGACAGPARGSARRRRRRRRAGRPRASGRAAGLGRSGRGGSSGRWRDNGI